MSFANQAAFDSPDSYQMALGIDLCPAAAITDGRGNVLTRKQTGGMLSPSRYELRTGAMLYRFGSQQAGAVKIANGGWWMDQQAFSQLERFGEVHGLALGMAMRILCLVPPEWSDATLLVRARVATPLLAWRGLANSVATPAAKGGGVVSMPHQNEIAARRLNQLFVPGLAALPPDAPGLRVEQGFALDEAAGKRGFIYL